MSNMLRDFGPDALCAVGACAMLHGISMIYVPAAYIVAGVLMVAAGVLKGRPAKAGG